jgi:hypothetical protein
MYRSESLAMTKAKQLSKKQLAAVEDLFTGELAEQAVLDKYKVSRKLYNKWLADEVFAEQCDQHIVGAYRQSALLIARYVPVAAAKIVQLTESGKEETARKTCLDIIFMRRPAERLAATPVVAGNDPTSVTSEPPQLSPETAGRLLAVLAEERGEESGPRRL